MREAYGAMEFRKFFSEESVSGTVTTTYLWYADYKASSPIKKYWYEQATDISREIWRIRKITTDSSTGITETFYPDWDPAKYFAWSARVSLTYI